MIKNAFIESLKIVDGRFIHPELHWQRITDTQRVHFGNSTFLPLSSESIPPDKRLGTLKCRIIYDQKNRFRNLLSPPGSYFKTCRRQRHRLYF